MADQSEKLAKKEGKGRVGIGGLRRRKTIDDIVDQAQKGESQIEADAKKRGEKRRN